ncbi:hypothetical protein ATK36_1835 [Amycolatopsis sulphurea]|uniref:Uncharacterized protein n=1 Tax=Amycolatopsis sulphurea TaxID=76022 RepID=A0A2A9F8S7_9PSEU|nr:hypothetical protein [Amycolatopsis sulphurea]PFG46835.1 hypothetical protein ATK36_1835 [Amycolatopsis sulphurea]
MRHVADYGGSITSDGMAQDVRDALRTIVQPVPAMASRTSP